MIVNMGRGRKNHAYVFLELQSMGSWFRELTLGSNSPVSLGHQRGFRGPEMHMLSFKGVCEYVWRVLATVCSNTCLQEVCM